MNGTSVIADARREFYRLAGAAIKAGLITPAEMVAIARPGTRKAGYWGRHLHDLRSLLKEREARQTAQPPSMSGNTKRRQST
jgi:hypothetical protein